MYNLFIIIAPLIGGMLQPSLTIKLSKLIGNQLFVKDN